MSGDRFGPADALLPYYITDTPAIGAMSARPVAVGDRGACSVADGVPGLVVGLQAETNAHGHIQRWHAIIRYPNHRTVIQDAYKLYWVEPTRELTVYLPEELYQRLAQGTLPSASYEDQVWEAVREAARQEDS